MGSGVERVGCKAESLVPARLRRLHKLLKGAAQLQIFVGLAGLALGALADYVASNSGGLRVPAIPEVPTFQGLQRS